MESQKCVICQKSKAPLSCGHCLESVCKSCAQFMEEDAFSFLSEVPKDIAHSTYCGVCYDKQVAPALADYNNVMEKAKNVQVFFKTQSKETRLISRVIPPVKITDCADHDEGVLRLAFFAAKENFNAIIDVQMSSKKVKSGSYQTMSWSGSAVPANVNQDKLVKDRSIWQNPN